MGGKKEPHIRWPGYVNTEPLPCSRVRSRFLPCLWADGRSEEWAILAPLWTLVMQIERQLVQTAFLWKTGFCLF